MKDSKLIQKVNEFRLFGAGYVAYFDVEDTIGILQAADDLYYNDAESFLTDSEYDSLRRAAQEHHPEHPYFQGIGSKVRGGKIKLPAPMGSLTQAYDGDMAKWVAKHRLEKAVFLVTEKLDGVSVLIVYDEHGRLKIAYSRGDGTEGADITRHISKIESVPVRIAERTSMMIRAEVIISKENFKKVQPLVKSRSGQPYKNARNMIAGLMNAETNPDIVYNYIDVVAYEVIGSTIDKEDVLAGLYEDNQFTVPAFVTMVGAHLTDSNVTKVLNKMRDESSYEIDGVVVEVNNTALRAKINPTKDTLNPEYARKFKVADASNVAIATVKEVEWNISKDGYLKPRVRIEPVELVGVTVQHATGFNAKFIKENGIGPGAKIQITRSGDVIPFIQEVIESVAPQMPTVDAVWTPTGVDLIVKNKEENDTVKFESLRDFFATLDVPALKEGNVKTLFDAGFTTPESIITMTDADLRTVIGKAIGQKIFDGLRAKFTNIPLYELMGAHPAFGRGVGVRKMKKLYEAFEGYMEKCQDIDKIVAVEGFDEKTAKKIVAGWPVFQQFQHNIRRHYTVARWEAPKAGGLSGSVFVFTGFRSKELEEKVVELGGKMGSAVSSKTTYLVAEDKDSTSGKAKKARELGVKVIGQDELRKLLGM